MLGQTKGLVDWLRRYGGLRLSFIIMTAAMLVTPARAQITFSFNYTDANGVGFNAADPQGANRKAALEQTGVLLSNLFPAYTATITIDVDGSNTENGTLAAASSNFNSNAAQTCVAGYNRGDVGIKVLGGTDPNSAVADGSVTVNFEDISWDLDDVIDPNAFDFKSTILHELMHAMGFSHSVTETGSDPCGQVAPTAGSWIAYDKHLGNTTANFINASYVINTSSWSQAVTGGTGNDGVLWRGGNAMTANNGNPVPLYSPTTFSAGSSVAHLDDDFFTSENLLMEAATDPGPGTRTLSAIEKGMMKDIGYDKNSISKKTHIIPIYMLLLK
jgi:hypothetical protein